MIFICIFTFSHVKAQDNSDCDALQAFLNDKSVKETLKDFNLSYCDGKIRLSSKNLKSARDYYLNDQKLDTSDENFKDCTWIYFSTLKKDKYSVLFKTPNLRTGEIETSEQLLFKFKVSRKKCEVKNLKVIKRHAHARY